MRLVMVLLFYTFATARSARILAIYPTPSISHQVVFRELTESLARKGHAITVMTTDPVHYADNIFENITEINVHEISYRIWRAEMDFVSIGNEDSLAGFLAYYNAMLKITDAQLETANMKIIINDNCRDKYDLFIGEYFIPTIFAFANKCDIPFVSITSLLSILANLDAVGSPSHPILYPDIVSTNNHLSKLSIWGKIEETFRGLKQRYHFNNYMKQFSKLSEKHFGANINIGDVISKVDASFMNYNQIFHGIRPSTPGLIFFSNLHLKEKMSLNQELEDYLNNSKRGVVYFSLGSNVLSKDLPPTMLRTINDAFKELPFNILWKFEDTFVPNKPNNVFISKWFPQRDLLGHPNIKVFVTQGGLQSLEEAIFNEVPLVGIPFSADQDLNVEKIQSWGIGIKLTIATVTTESLKRAIMDVAENQLYKNNIRKLSALLRDQPAPPGPAPVERVVWWTEYVLRHRGAAHLRAPAAGLPWYHYFMLDVAAVVISAILIAIFIIIRFVKFIIRLKLFNVNTANTILNDPVENSAKN